MTDMAEGADRISQVFPARREADEFRQSSQSGSFWTSSRCRRLLRPLQSRLAALRKLALTEKAGPGQDACENDGLDPAHHHRPTKRTNTQDDKDDFEGQRKRPRRTYSRRTPTGTSIDEYRPKSKAPLRIQSRHRMSSISTPGVPNVSTPILRKVRQDTMTAIPSNLTLCEKTAGFCMLSRVGKRGPLESSLNELGRLRYSLQPSRYQLYEGIIHDLYVLLRSTTPKHDTVGKKSLLAMCLQKVPRCAAEIEAWEVSKAANHGPVSSIKKMSYSLRVYDELETLGGAGNGWSHLRIVLRAHVIYLLREIITEGLLDINFIHLIIEHCRAMDCPGETAELSMALFCCSCHGASGDVNTLPNGEVGGRILASLPSFADKLVVESHLLDTFASLLLSGQLPIDTVSTKAFGYLWSTTTSAILEQKAHSSATRFASAGLAALCVNAFPIRRGRMSETSTTRHNAAKLTLMSVLGALSAMAMISQDFGNTTNTREIRQRTRTQKVVLHIFYLALGVVRGQRARSEAAYPLLLAIFLSVLAGPAHDSATQLKIAVENFGDGLGERRASCTGGNTCQLLDVTVALTCSIAHCCGRATAQQSNQYFAEICKLVGQLGVPCFVTLQADGAFFLAQKTDDLRDLVFAETSTGALAGKGRAVTACEGSSKTFFAGFQWEEGISEWIAVSPAARRRNIIAREEVAAPRRSARHSHGDTDVQLNRFELETTTGSTDKGGPWVTVAPTASDPDNNQVDQRLAWRRQRPHKEYHGSSGDARAAMDGIDELSMCQENRPRVLGKSRLGKQTTGTGQRNQCRRIARSVETGPREALDELCTNSRSTLTGHGDEDELGL
ncbi:hypothetical protein CH63R_02579 [Colletotrichum higginsianum IMI 349063]|uniref:Uncharacterized protein n=1 Tax=Colletotrichum higginsianum (strain IMI 349063) TaxID=759273 RepID=A0A1B7YPB0_COLHI|nr:hypothetical protein CH63R_02579 [Colletotrichum higginsianum IMI 349063]OBR13853.1 hypothetical protein CH63R_02579 [Colletotrichum higginsianum IMI 349063]